MSGAHLEVGVGPVGGHGVDGSGCDLFLRAEVVVAQVYGELAGVETETHTRNHDLLLRVS